MNERKLFWKIFVYRLIKILMTSLLVVIMFFSFSKVCIAPNEVFVDKKFIFKQIREMINNSLSKEVDLYIKKYAPESILSANQLVEICDMFEFDLKLGMAQGHLESHFGTRGRAAETNSVFNVGTYDDGRVLYTYEEPNESIEPYVFLVKNYYLVDSTSVDDLLYDRFVNFKGKRYSTSRSYERKLLKIMDIISQETDIDRLLSQRKDCDDSVRVLMGYPEKRKEIESQYYLTDNNN